MGIVVVAVVEVVVVVVVVVVVGVVVEGLKHAGPRISFCPGANALVLFPLLIAKGSLQGWCAIVGQGQPIPTWYLQFQDMWDDFLRVGGGGEWRWECGWKCAGEGGGRGGGGDS